MYEDTSGRTTLVLDSDRLYLRTFVPPKCATVDLRSSSMVEES